MKTKMPLLIAAYCLTFNLLYAVPPNNTRAASHPVAADTLKNSIYYPIGVAVDEMSLMTDPKYRSLILKDFNSITPENMLMWNHLRPSENTFDFSRVDSIVNFALKHHIRMIGHPLVYFQTMPDWVENFQGDSAAWEHLLKNHIQTVVGRYRGKMAGWIVVNELFDSNGNYRMDAENKKFINVWAQHLGPGYIARAFIYAHQADPNAVLFISDYDQEKYSKKMMAIVNLANQLKARHVPVGGIALQMHTDINVTLDGINYALTQSQRTGLQVYISELDIRLNPKDLTLSPTDAASNLGKQNKLFYYIPHAYNALVPRSQQFGITFWGITDKNSWITRKPVPDDAPLLFDTNYKEKGAYNSFLRGLTQ